MELKDEILKDNRELEIRLKSQIETYSSKFSSNISIFQKRINEMKENNTKVMNSLPDMNFHITKIAQIEKFDLKTENRLSSHDLRLTAILTEIEKIKTKYDKIVLDNLYVPGHVGGHCKFTNLSDYLTFNINEVALLKAESEQLKNDTKSMKNKHDNTIKQIVNLIDGSVKRCNEYTENKQKDFQLLLDTKMREFNEKIMEIRMNVCKIQMKTEEEYSNLNIGFNRLLEEKKEFTNFFQNKLIGIQKDLSNLQNDYKTNINDVKQKNKTNIKDVQNIKENINTLIQLIKYYEKRNNKNISNNNNSSDDEKKTLNIKRNQANLIKDFESSNRVLNINNSVGIKNSNIQRNRRNSLNRNIKINVANSVNPNVNFRRSNKKRNTMFYTGPILKLPINNKGKKNLKDSSNANAPNLYGLINPLLHKIVDSPTKKETENIKNESHIDFSLYSERNNSKEKKINFNDDKNETLNKIMNSHLSSNSNSNSDSESESSSSSKDETINDFNSSKASGFKFPKKKKRSNSKQYYSKLRLNPNDPKEIRKSGLSNSKLLTIKEFPTKNKNKKNQKNKINNNVKFFFSQINKTDKKKGSISSVQSLKIKYNNNDLTDILNKKIYLNSKNINNNIKDLKEKKNLAHSVNPKNYKNGNVSFRKYNEDAKNNNINFNNNIINSKNDNIMKAQKIAENSKNNLEQIKNINNITISQTISRNNINQISTNSQNPAIPNFIKNNYQNIPKTSIFYANNFSNTINIYPSTKNHKISKILTPQNRNSNSKANVINNIQSQKNIEVDSDTGVGLNVVSFDIPENTSLPPKKNQYYTLFGKKLQKKHPIKTEIISPLDEIYKQQYNKKMKLESLSNSNNLNDMPKKISPIFGRTAYAFYSKKDIEEFGGSLTNSANIKGINNTNLINNNIIGNNSYPINIKLKPKGKK